MHVDREHKSQPQVDGEHRRSARREEGQRDADDGQHHEAHAHVDKDLRGDEGKDADADEPAEGILRAAGVVEHLAAERPEEGDDGQAPDIAERFADEGEDKVVVHLGDILVADAEEPLAPDLSRTDRELGVILLVKPAEQVGVGVEEREDALLLVGVYDIVPGERRGGHRRQ